MRNFISKFTNYGGIVTSIVNPPPNTFKTLKNLRQDIEIGALRPRYGVKYSRSSPSPIKTLDAQAFVKAGEIQTQYFLGKKTVGGTVIANPGVLGGVTTDSTNAADVDLLASFSAAISAVGTTTITVNSSFPSNGIFKYAIVRNISLKPHKFAVVKAISVITGNVTLTLNKDVSAEGWLSTHTILFYTSDVLASYQQNVENPNTQATRDFGYSTISRPHFVNVGGRNDYAILGIADSLYHRSLWAGRIDNRSYFGKDGFSYNGIYATSLMDDFTYGAFRSQDAHVQVKVVDTATITNYERLAPDKSQVIPGEGTFNPVGSPAPPTNWECVDEADTAVSDVDYSQSTATQTFAREIFGFPVPTKNIDPDGNGYIRVRMRYSSVGTGSVIAGISLRKYSSGDAIAYKDVVIDKNFTYYDLVFENKNIPDFNDLAVGVQFISGLIGTNVQYEISWVSMSLSLSGYSPIQIPEDGVAFLNFSIMEDAANETRLIYDKSYGIAESMPTNYSASNALLLTANSNKSIWMRIGTKYGELINRRAVELRVYGAIVKKQFEKIEAKDLVWRLCQRISLNDSKWKFANGEYYIEVLVGDEINTGELYIDRTGCSTSDNMVKTVKYGASAGERTFAVDESQGKIVYFSPINDNGFAGSVLASSNFFAIARSAHDISGLFAINKKLLIFTKFAVKSIGITGLPSAPDPDTISDEHGLASFASVAASERLLFFVSYDGIYATDGFTEKRINVGWLKDFLAYSKADVEAAIGFYSIYYNSYYVYIANTLWAYDLKDGQWRTEDLVRMDVGIDYAKISFAATDEQGYTSFIGTDNLVYQYPRSDKQFYDSIHLPLQDVNFDISAEWETNDTESEFGLDELMYVNNAYLRGDGVENITSGISLYINKGIDTVKSFLVDQSRGVKSATTRRPLDRFSVRGVLSYNSEFVIREFGLYMTAMRRTGKTKKSIQSNLPIYVVISPTALTVSCAPILESVSLCILIDDSVQYCSWLHNKCEHILGTLWINPNHTFNNPTRVNILGVEKYEKTNTLSSSFLMRLV